MWQAHSGKKDEFERYIHVYIMKYTTTSALKEIHRSVKSLLKFKITFFPLI